MLAYCLKCRRKKQKVKTPRSNTNVFIKIRSAVRDSKKSRFMKNQEANGLLSNLGLKTPLSKIPLLGNILFQRYKMNEIVNKFILAGDKIMPEMHLRQPECTNGPYTKNRGRI